MIEIKELVDERGRSYFARWFDGLDAIAAAKVTIVLGRMEQGNLGDTKSVGGGVLERRVTFGPGYRVYFGRDGDALIILLGGGTKRRQSRDIEEAQVLLSEYLARHRRGA